MICSMRAASCVICGSVPDQGSDLGPMTRCMSRQPLDLPGSPHLLYLLSVEWTFKLHSMCNSINNYTYEHVGAKFFFTDIQEDTMELFLVLLFFLIWNDF